MKERPILFSAPMVRALLEGRKTQTRRIVNDAPIERDGYLCTKLVTYRNEKQVRGIMPSLCPYGKPGDRLWVREAFMFVNVDRERNLICIAYDADGAHLPTRVDIRVTPEQLADFMGDERDKIDPFHRRRYPAMFMNRCASRIMLGVEEVRVERLQDCSDDDAEAEGIFARRCIGDGPGHDIWSYEENGLRYSSPRRAYEVLWESINGVGSWAANPWVWVVRFSKVA